LKLYYIDNVKRPHESTSVEESKKLHASRGDENERDADRSALSEAGDSRKKKKCYDEKTKGWSQWAVSACTDITNQVSYLQEMKLVVIAL